MTEMIPDPDRPGYFIMAISQSQADDSARLPTFEEYTAWYVEDGEPPPSRAEYDAAVQTPAIGEVGMWRGVTFIDEGGKP